MSIQIVHNSTNPEIMQINSPLDTSSHSSSMGEPAEFEVQSTPEDKHEFLRRFQSTKKGPENHNSQHRRTPNRNKVLPSRDNLRQHLKPQKSLTNLLASGVPNFDDAYDAFNTSLPMTFYESEGPVDITDREIL